MLAPSLKQYCADVRSCGCDEPSCAVLYRAAASLGQGSSDDALNHQAAPSTAPRRRVTPVFCCCSSGGVLALRSSCARSWPRRWSSAITRGARDLSPSGGHAGVAIGKWFVQLSVVTRCALRHRRPIGCPTRAQSAAAPGDARSKTRDAGVLCVRLLGYCWAFSS